MDYIFLIMAAMAGYYAHTYAVWLRSQKNVQGAIGVYLIVMTSIGVSLYNLLNQR